MVDFLDQSTEIQQVSASFLAYRNDIEIYTEDEIDDKVFYVDLFNRLLDGTGVRIRDVQPLGSCDQVEEAYNRDSNREGKIYIMDGDIYVMFAPKPSTEHLYVLDSYCIENYLCDEDAFTHYTYFKWGTKTKAECKSALDFNARIDAVCTHFLELYHYFATQKALIDVFDLRGVAAFYDEKKFLMKPYSDSIKEIILKEIKQRGISEQDIQNKLDEISAAWPATRENFLKVVSGKEWLLPYFSSVVGHVTQHKTGESNRPMKLKLAQCCDLSRLEGLKRAMLNVARK